MKTKVVLFTALTFASSAYAGRGSSPGAVKSAISSDGYDAIATELERAEHLVCPSCVPMVRALVDHQDRRVRQVAAWWLARRGLKQDLLESMSERLTGDDAVKARNAADVLGGLRLPDAVAPLGAALTAGRFNAEARSAMARAIGEIGDIDGQPALVTALRAREPSVRAAAVESLRDLRGFEDAAAAASLLADTDADVRAEAVSTIGFLRARAGTQPVRAMAALVASDPSARVRKKAAWALGEIGAAADVAGPSLRAAAQHDSDPLVRSIASAALARLSL